MTNIEQAAAEDIRSGACRKWFGDADAITRKVRLPFVVRGRLLVVSLP